MELDLDHRAGSSSHLLEPSRDRFEAKFHYGILITDRSEAGRRPVADMLARASSLLAS